MSTFVYVNTSFKAVHYCKWYIVLIMACAMILSLNPVFKCNLKYVLYIVSHISVHKLGSPSSSTQTRAATTVRKVMCKTKLSFSSPFHRKIVTIL